jgi:Protein of unknown function (DUF2815)
MNFQLIEKVRITTPACKFQYPKLIEPETKFNPEGVYKVTAMLDVADADAVATQLDELLNRHKESLKAQAPTQKFKLADLPWAFDEVDGTPYFLVKTKMKAKGVDRDGRAWSAAPALFDAKGHPVKDRDSLKGMWSGTVGKVSFEACPFYQPAIGAGITLRLRAVQILSLVEGGGSAGAFGFEEEDGWQAGTTSAVPFDSSNSIAIDDADF